MRTRFRKAVVAVAGAAGSLVRVSMALSGVIGAACVVFGVEQVVGRGWAWMAAGAFILLASWELGRTQGRR